MTVMCFFFKGFGEVGGFAAISYEIYKFTCCFAVEQKTFWRGGSQSHECVSMTYFEDCLSNQLLVVVFCWKVKGWWGPTFPKPQILRTCPRHHHPPPKSSEHKKKLNSLNIFQHAKVCVAGAYGTTTIAMTFYVQPMVEQGVEAPPPS